jgi:tRNA A-37 threonylcarbamoyl transferase component Bud32
MKTCKRCGGPMAGNAPEGMCARCLLSVAIKEPTGTGSTAMPASGPSPEELAPHFPQFEILELLGRGGMGVVYKARQRQLDRIVALKILPPDASVDSAFAERFAREARALARLSHPNIVAVHDFGQSEGLFYLVMEFVDGANLRHLIETKSITPEQALAIVPKICDALQYAHEEGVMHRDIKPENILIDKRGRVKIADFGLAKLLGLEAADLALTQAGMSLGTPRYMAPEQVEHPEQVDHRADIYSLGVVFYEMLTGELPLGRFAPPSQRAHVDVRLDEVVLRSLEKDVERRYQHASEVKTDLDSIAGLIANLPPQLRRAMGFEYRSKREFLGLPLLHVAFGVDPVTGKGRTARGIVAMGERAQGVFAFGGLAVGVMAFGGIGVGIISFAGASLGLIAFGGFGLGLLAAYGGMVIAPVAIGGVAVGYIAAGGAAFGAHATGGNVHVDDRLARAVLRTTMGPITNLFYAMLPVGVIVPIVMRLLGERWAGQGLGASSPGKPHRWTPQFIAFVILIGLVVIVTFFSLLLPVIEKSTGLVPN